MLNTLWVLFPFFWFHSSILIVHNNQFSLKTVFPTDGLALSHSKSNAFWPAQQAVATYLRSKKHKAIFFTGEEELRSMTCGLEKEDKTDGRYKYYADGVLQWVTMNSIMEVSFAYEKAQNTKLAFNHYKAMFSALSIMKHIVSKYKYASFDISRALVVHIIHVHGKKKATLWWPFSKLFYWD